MHVCYIPPLLSHFSVLRFSVQLERRCSPSRNAFPSSCLVFPRGIRKFLAISYSDNLRKTCHFHVAWTPAILVFSADQYQRGALLLLLDTRRDDGGWWVKICICNRAIISSILFHLYIFCVQNNI